VETGGGDIYAGEGRVSGRCRPREARLQHVRQVRIKKPVFLLISLFLSRELFWVQVMKREQEKKQTNEIK
jgi:hypothetical protein